MNLVWKYVGLCVVSRIVRCLKSKLKLYNSIHYYSISFIIYVHIECITSCWYKLHTVGFVWAGKHAVPEETICSPKSPERFQWCRDRYYQEWGKYEYWTILLLIIQLIYFEVCSCIYRICSDRTWGKYEYGTILQLIIQLIHFTVCSCIYRICSDRI